MKYSNVNIFFWSVEEMKNIPGEKHTVNYISVVLLHIQLGLRSLEFPIPCTISATSKNKTVCYYKFSVDKTYKPHLRQKLEFAG